MKFSLQLVVKLYEVIDEMETGFMYMVLEYALKGQVMTLQEGKTNPIDEDTSWKYFRDLISGIDYRNFLYYVHTLVHVQNIVHRDIKPENLLIFEKETLKICDFGVAQVLDDQKGQSMSSTRGSPAFLAPEIFSCKLTLFLNAKAKSFKGKPVDIWAAGVTLYCFIFGHVPFAANNFFELNKRINTEE